MGIRIFRYIGDGFGVSMRVATNAFGLLIYWALALLGVLAVAALIYSLT